MATPEVCGDLELEAASTELWGTRQYGTMARGWLNFLQGVYTAEVSANDERVVVLANGSYNNDSVAFDGSDVQAQACAIAQETIHKWHAPFPIELQPITLQSPSTHPQIFRPLYTTVPQAPTMEAMRGWWAHRYKDHNLYGASGRILGVFEKLLDPNNLDTSRIFEAEQAKDWLPAATFFADAPAGISNNARNFLRYKIDSLLAEQLENGRPASYRIVAVDGECSLTPGDGLPGTPPNFRYTRITRHTAAVIASTYHQKTEMAQYLQAVARGEKP